MKLRTLVGIFALMTLGAARVHAQVTPPAAAADTASPLRVFIDCQFSCDMNLIRTEMTWVDYMNDRADAQVHVLVTEQSTGGGGSQYTLNFIGLKQFATLNDTLTYTSTSEDSQDKTRRGLSKMIQLGLTPFIARTPLGARLNISVAAAPESGTGAPAAPKHDPWNFWTFRLSFNGSRNGESNTKSENYRGGISAGRVTEDWKVSLGANVSENHQEFTFGGETDEYDSESRSASGNLVKSLGANFSAGLRGDISKSSYGNNKLAWSVMPAVEYDFFPYKESSRRMLTAQYAIGIRSFQYQDTTIYFKIKEAHPQHSLNLSYYTQEQWGSVNLSGNYSQYLHDKTKYNAGIFGSTDVRLFKGFSFNVFADYSKVHDQLSLPKGGATEEEVLLRQREIATDFRYYVSFGLSYRFGSIFNNVVNPRMGGGGGGGMVMYF